MPYGSQSDKRKPIYHLSVGTRQPPYSSPPIVSSSSVMYEASQSRSGNNAPYIKGGILTIPIRVARHVRAIVGTYMAPRRVKVRYWDKRKRRAAHRWIIIYVRRNVWGVKVVYKTVYKRVKQEDPGLLLRPNNLDYDATYDPQSSMSANYIAAAGLPTELRINTTQEGRTSGRQSGAGTALIGTGPIPWPSIVSRQNDLKKQALSGLYSRVSEESTNIALMLAESGKSIDMLMSVFLSGMALMRSLKKLDLAGASRVITGSKGSDLANRWLAFQYGVKPLISDAISIAEDLERQSRAWRKYSCGRAGSVRTATTSSYQFSDTEWTFEIDITEKCSVILDTNFSYGRSLKAHGFTNFAGLAWELVPFSFTVDWFYPIGNYLNSMNAFGTNVVSYYTTSTVLYSASYSSTHHSYSNFIGAGVGPEGSLTRFTCKRVVGNVPPLPLPSINKSPFNVTRLISALSLFLQRR